MRSEDRRGYQVDDSNAGPHQCPGALLVFQSGGEKTETPGRLPDRRRLENPKEYRTARWLETDTKVGTILAIGSYSAMAGRPATRIEGPLQGKMLAQPHATLAIAGRA